MKNDICLLSEMCHLGYEYAKVFGFELSKLKVGQHACPRRELNTIFKQQKPINAEEPHKRKGKKKSG